MKSLRVMWERYTNHFRGYKSFNWKGLLTSCNSLFVKQTYIFVLIVPAIANVLGSIDSVVKSFSIGEFSLSIPVVMPVKWEILFYSAIFLLISRVLVITGCPDSEFIEGGVVEFDKKGKKYLDLLRYTQEYSSYFNSTEELIKIKNKIEASSEKSTIPYKDFLTIYDAMNESRYFIRLLIMHFMICGYVLAAIVVIMNITSVVNLQFN